MHAYIYIYHCISITCISLRKLCAGRSFGKLPVLNVIYGEIMHISHPVWLAVSTLLLLNLSQESENELTSWSPFFEWNGKILATDNQLGCSRVLDRMFSPNFWGLAPKRAKWPHRFKPSQAQGTPQHVASGTLGRTFWGSFMVSSPQLDPVFFRKKEAIQQLNIVGTCWDKRNMRCELSLWWLGDIGCLVLDRSHWNYSCWIPVPIAWPRLLINFKCHKLQQAFSGLQDTKGNVNFSWEFFKEFVWKMFDHGRFRTSRSGVLSVVHCCTFWDKNPKMRAIPWFM